MIRRLLPSALCLFLSPLLVAQQTVQQQTSPAPQPAPQPASSAPIPPQITLVSDAPIHIITPGNVALAKIKPGTTVRFFSDSDVIVNGVKVIAALTPVDGVVEKVTRASHFRNRPVEVLIQVAGTAPATAANILLRCSIPADDSFGFAISGVLTTLAIIAVLFFVLAIASM